MHALPKMDQGDKEVQRTWHHKSYGLSFIPFRDYPVSTWMVGYGLANSKMEMSHEWLIL